MPRKPRIPSRRSCPDCGARTYYVPTLLSRITGYSSRKCERCSYVDPIKVKVYRGSDPMRDPDGKSEDRRWPAAHA